MEDIISRLNAFNAQPEEGDAPRGVIPESDPRPQVEDVQPEVEELEGAAEAEETSETSETETETEDLDDGSYEPWTVESLAEALEKSPDELLEELQLDVNGEKVSIASLHKGNLRESDYTKKTMSLAEERKAFESQRDAKLNAWEQEIQVGAQLIGASEQVLMNEYNAVNWQELKDDDPNEFVVKRQEFNERYQQIQNLKYHANQQYQKLQQEREEEIKQKAPKEYEALVNKIPAWTDTSVAEKEGQALTKYLMQGGYSSDELAKMYDHRAYVNAYKAMKYDELKAKAPEAKEKLKKVPKVLKPKAAKPKLTSKQKQTQALRAKLRKTGDGKVATQLIKDLMYGG